MFARAAFPPPDPAARWGLPTRVFGGETRLAATARAIEWLEARKFSVGTMERDNPLGVKLGNCFIAKWSTLSTSERGALHGRVFWGADGSAVVELWPSATNEAVAAFQREV